ncbi:hypothetical protein QFC22_004877 [Naganishia vaughanmartiniae]|uniref:Uncharacterized protein n=1 Tax=Naganishia vaughanmartiniae TaxID=1424756 RepID=A0ACC2WYP2_9TREE|nr:hypothetical protein QFC22_004877 [Naganishia vaughanmartiniae]
MDHASPLSSPDASRNYQHATNEIPNSETRHIEASLSSISGTSSHLIRSREPTVEYAARPTTSMMENSAAVRRMESEIEWLYERNAELQDENDRLKQELTKKDREHRQSKRRLQTQLDTVHATLHDAERQNRSLEATIRLLNQRSTEAVEGARRFSAELVRYPPPPADFGIPRMQGLPANSSTTDSLCTTVSTDSVWKDQTPSPPVMGVEDSVFGHRRTGSIILEPGHQPERRIRKKVSWRDECGPSAALCQSYPATPVAYAASSSESPTRQDAPSNEITPTRSPTCPDSRLTPAPPSLTQWLGLQSERVNRRSDRRLSSATPPLASAASLYEELGPFRLRPSASEVSSQSRHVSGASAYHELNRVGDEEGTLPVLPDAVGGTDVDVPLLEENEHSESPHDATYLERCKAILEDRGSDFWMQMQFWCVVGVFIAGVLSRGTDGVVELGKRR